MFGMVTMRARKLRTCHLGMSRWSVGWWPTSAWKRTLFHAGLSSPRSDTFWFVPRTPGCWHSMGPSVSSATGKKSWVPLGEMYLFLFLTAAVSAALALVMALCCR